MRAPMASSPRKPPASGPVAPVTASSLREGQLGTGLKVKLPPCRAAGKLSGCFGASSELTGEVLHVIIPY